MRFVAYWPDDSNITIDNQGNIVDGTCSLFAVLDPVSHETETITLQLKDYETPKDSKE